MNTISKSIRRERAKFVTEDAIRNAVRAREITFEQGIERARDAGFVSLAHSFERDLARLKSKLADTILDLVRDGKLTEVEGLRHAKLSGIGDEIFGRRLSVAANRFGLTEAEVARRAAVVHRAAVA